MKKALQACIFLLLFLIVRLLPAQVLINEFVPANVDVSVGSNHSYQDWIELYNDGSSNVDLQGYGLSDDISKPYQFRFPSYVLRPGDYVIVFAADTTNDLYVDHYETAVTASTTWKYFVGTSQPDTNWRNLSFNDGSWSSGNGGIGSGDGDDATVITSGVKSVMMRKTFIIPDTSEIMKAIFNMDYDDGFVAYLNGSEIARANLGVAGDRPTYNILATVAHEAVMYQGQDPDSFFVDPDYLRTILRQGTNVLAVEVHNQSTTSNDLTSKPYLTFGMRSPGSTFSNPPSWFNEPDEEYFSAKFKLTRTGETLYLTNPSGAVVDQQSYTEMQSDHSMGRKPDGSNNWCLIKTPTPLSTNNNSTCYTGYAIQPGFSLAAGFYPNSQWLALTNSTPGGVIRYTTNGDEPTTSSSVYSSPIHLTSSKVVRAKVFASGYLPSSVYTNSYIIDEDIQLPVFSVSTDYDNLWDYNTGIYVMGPNADPNYPYFGANFWQDWERPAAIEYFDKNKNKIFGFDAVIKNFGNYSRAKPQKSIEIKLKDQYGTGELNYAFIPDKSFIDKTDNIILRNSGTDWNEVHFRDAFMQRVMKPTHSGYLAAEPAVMYLNGEFWGVFTIHENHDHHWIENNSPYKEEEVDYLKEGGSTIEEKNGDADFFWQAYNYSTTQNPNASQYYDQMNEYWDLDNYKDYFIAETYYANGDWIGDWTNNIKMWRPRETGGKLKYLLYDLDFGLGYGSNYKDSTLARSIDPLATSYSSNMFDALLDNNKFRIEFINRYADLINTVYKPSSMLAIMHQFQDSMAYDMPEHFAKWGSTMSGWQSRINSMTGFINNRPNEVRNQIIGQFGLSKKVTLTFNVSPAGAGRIQVSTIVPESYPWTGVYFDGNPVTITAIPNPGFTFDRWDSNHAINNDHNQTTTYNFAHSTESITAYFSGSAQPPLLTISELNYNSGTSIHAEDWIELHNYGTQDLDISNWKLKDSDDNNSFEFPVGTIIPANGYLVVASDLAAFNTSYPTVNNVTGPLGFQFDNNGDQVRIYDALNQLYLSFYYQDTPPWPIQADGAGFTCELNSNTADPNDGNSWFAGCLGGSPGKAYSPVLSTTTQLNGYTTICIGGQTVLSLNNTPGYSYQWQLNYVDIPSATDTIYIATQAGSYRVRVINQGCSSVSDTLTVSVVISSQTPVTNSESRCGEGTVTFTASSTDSLYWFDAPNGSIVGTGPTFTTPLLTGTTTYYVQTSLSCPSQQVAVDAEIIPVTANPVVSDITRCGPGAVTLNAVDTAVVHWFNDAVNGAHIYTGNVFVTGYIPHDTTFYAEAGTVCVSERVAVNVTINSSPPPLVNTSSRCGPGQLVLTASSLAPVFWYDSVVAGNQVGSGVNFLTPSLAETKTYYVESNNGCASARVPVDAMIHSIPDPPVGYDSSGCGSGSVPIYATSAVQIFWYSTPTGGTALGSGSLFNTPVINTNTTYYAESFDICSSTRTPVQAIVNAIPASPVGNDASICGMGQAYLSASATDPIYWFAQDTGSQVLGTGNSFMTPVLASTTTFYAVAISDCPSVPTPVTATVIVVPQVFLGNDTTIQSGASIVLDAGPGYDSYLWSNGATTRTISVSTTGVFYVEALLNGCSSTDTINLTVILGIQDNSTFDGTIHVFPNPVKESLTIHVESQKFTKAEIYIRELTGKVLFRKSVSIINGFSTENIDMNAFATGIYLVTILSDDFTKTLSVIVE